MTLRFSPGLAYENLHALNLKRPDADLRKELGQMGLARLAIINSLVDGYDG